MLNAIIDHGLSLDELKELLAADSAISKIMIPLALLKLSKYYCPKNHFPRALHMTADEFVDRLDQLGFSSEFVIEWPNSYCDYEHLRKLLAPIGRESSLAA